MYCITDEQVAYILNDIRRSGVEMEDLQLNLLDHICCKVEQEFKENDDFERFYRQTIQQLCDKGLYEIEEETINLLTFKNYYFMKKAMMITGGVSTVIFLSGCFFKLMHWPGASALILLGIVLMSLVFLPLGLLLKGKEPEYTVKDRLVLVSGAIAGILYYMATLFTVMHWPGSSQLWFAAVGASMLVFIPAYFLTNIGRPEKKANTIFTSVLLIGAVGLIFTMLRVRQPEPVQMYTFIKNEQLLKNMQHTFTNDTTRQSNPLATNINNTCASIKELILQQEIGQPSIPADYEHTGLVINEHNIGSFLGSAKTAALLAELKDEVSRYNASVSEENKIPVAHSFLDVPQERIDIYSNLSVLNSITQLQMFVTMTGQVKESAIAIK